nr:uncharacterized protein LOC131773795 [Pocillopora verrucosa]
MPWTNKLVELFFYHTHLRLLAHLSSSLVPDQTEIWISKDSTTVKDVKAVFSAAYFKYLTRYQDSEISLVPNDVGLLIVKFTLSLKPDPAEVVIHKRRINSRYRLFTSTEAREVEAVVNEKGSSLRFRQEKTPGKSLRMY